MKGLRDGSPNVWCPEARLTGASPVEGRFRTLSLSPRRNVLRVQSSPRYSASHTGPLHPCPGALLLDLAGSRSPLSPPSSHNPPGGGGGNSPPFPAPEFGLLLQLLASPSLPAKAVEAAASENIATAVNKISLFICSPFLGSLS